MAARGGRAGRSVVGLLEVVLDRSLVPGRGILGISASVAERAALSKEIPTLIQLDFDRFQMDALVGAQSFPVMQRVFLADELLDVIAESLLGCGHSRNPPKENVHIGVPYPCGSPQLTGPKPFDLTRRLHPDAVGRLLIQQTSVREVHDLHVWEITSGHPARTPHAALQSDHIGAGEPVQASGCPPSPPRRLSNRAACRPDGRC